MGRARTRVSIHRYRGRKRPDQDSMGSEVGGWDEVEGWGGDEGGVGWACSCGVGGLHVQSLDVVAGFIYLKASCREPVF